MLNKYIKIYKIDDSYGIKTIKDNSLYILAWMLCFDMGYAISYIINWIQSNEIHYGGNISHFEKKNGKIIVSLDPCLENPDFFQTSQEQFLKILEDWEKIIQKQPQEILITQDEQGNVEIIGKD